MTESIGWGMNTRADTSDPSDQERKSTESMSDAAERFGQAAGSVETAAAAVHSNVTSGIQPDVRDLRNLMADLRDTVSIAFRRIFWAVMACVALNAVVLIVVLTR
jgi:hypothetical protein